MCEIQCPYKDKCTSHPHKCGTCSRNTGKRDYYKPRRDWYTPYYPHWEWYPPYTWYTTTAGNNQTNWGTTTITRNT